MNIYPENKELLILDLTLDKPFPIFGIFIIDDKYPTFSFGIQGDNSPYNALYRGFLEASAVMEHTQGSFFYNNDKFIKAHDEKNKFNDLETNSLFLGE